MTGLNMIVYSAPFTFIFLYLTFGSDFFLLKLVDEVSIFLIQYWVSNFALIAHWSSISTIFGVIVSQDYNYQTDNYYGVNYCESYGSFWGGQSCPSRFVSALYLFLYSGMALYFDFNHISRGVDAIRHIDPFWNDHRRFLFPSLFYTFGIVKEEKGGSGRAPVDNDIDLTDV